MSEGSAAETALGFTAVDGLERQGNAFPERTSREAFGYPVEAEGAVRITTAYEKRGVYECACSKLRGPRGKRGGASLHIRAEGASTMGESWERQRAEGIRFRDANRHLVNGPTGVVLK